MPFRYLESNVVFYIQVGTNGYFTFERFTGYMPFTFSDNKTHALVAPFFADIDIRKNGSGKIEYEIHTNNATVLSQVNSLIGDRGHDFKGTWLLVATWDNVPAYYQDYSIVRLLIFLNKFRIF